MKKYCPYILFFFFLHNIAPAYANSFWQSLPARVAGANQPATNYLTYRLDEAALKGFLTVTARNNTGKVIDLPMPDGSFRSFIVTGTPILPPALAAKYPDISTYTAYCTDNQSITAKLDFTQFGFHAMIYYGGNTSFINPAANTADGVYLVYYKRDEINTAQRQCQTHGSNHSGEISATGTAPTTASTQKKVVNGHELRRYRLALACSHQYAKAATGLANPTVAQVLSKMTTTMNRVNGIYERELSVTMVFTEKQDTLIFTQNAGDPFSSYNFSIGAMLENNQYICDSLIGDANYDIGHALCTSDQGGLSSLGVICQSGIKAQSASGSANPTGDGFDVDYVSHEIGHEYGADHTFNNSQLGGCGGNAVAMRAYEPGSGSTIMAYAGLCSPDNLQANSDPYFHQASLTQMQHCITTTGDACAIKTPSGNKLPGIAPYTAKYTIPYKTPFELTAPTAIDSIGDSMITYCWEQWNLGDFGKTLSNTSLAGPLFRSFTPSPSPVRVFPNMKMVLSGTLSNAGIDKASGEKAPDAARYLTFKLAARKMHNGYGCFTLPDDTIHIDVANTGTGFSVTSQNTTGISYNGADVVGVTWNVAGTNTAPVSTPNVDIYLSADSGYSWPYHLGTFPNNGSATVTLPNPDNLVSQARIKVKGANNVFFNVNSKDFQLQRNLESSIKIYPVPAPHTMHVSADKTGTLRTAFYDITGKTVWSGDINGSADLPVYMWPRGMYFAKFVAPSGRTVIRKIIIE